MRHIEIVATVPGHMPDEVFPALCDYRRWPEMTDAIKSVKILEEEGNRTVSEWEASFNRGLLKWTEVDYFHPDTHTINFDQTGGDIDTFKGDWTVESMDGGSMVRFVADLDLGIPGLNDMLEPIAEQALRSNVRSILSGLFAVPVELEPVGQPLGT